MLLVVAASVLLVVGSGAGSSKALAAEIFATAEDERPEYVRKLEASFGAPSQSGFGSTVLFALRVDAATFEHVALAAYRHFTGKLWEAWGEAAWMGAWKLLYRRAGAPNIVAKLRELGDPLARSSAEMILDANSNPAAGQAALSAAFDDAGVHELLVFGIGDGAAMSGLLLAARRYNGEATFVVFLMD